MELSIQILTIIVDVLLIFLMLMLIIIAFNICILTKKIRLTVDNLSDLKFWINTFKNIGKGFLKGSSCRKK